MLLTLALIFGLCAAILSMTLFDWIKNPSDYWIILVAFVAGFVGFIILMFSTFFVMSLFVSVKKDYGAGKKAYYRCVCRVCEMLLMLGRVKVHVRGLNNIPLDKKFLIVSNHQSMYDSIASVWTLRGFPISFVLKDSLMKLFVVNKFLNACGYLSLNRSNAREGIKTIGKASQKISDDQQSIFICPEGTRSKKYEMGEFHSGSFKIASKAKCPIVIVSIQNGCQVSKRYPFRSTNLYFDVIEVLDYEDYKEKSSQEISDYAYNLIKENLENLPKY